VGCPIMFKRLSIVLIFLVPVLLPADEIEFVFLLGGQRVGGEKITVIEEAGARVLKSEMRYALLGLATDAQATLRLDRSGRPLYYSVEGKQSGFDIKSELNLDPESGEVSGRISYLGERSVRRVLSEDCLLLDASALAYERLVSRFDMAGRPIQRVNYFEPVFYAGGTAVIELLGEEETTGQDKGLVRHFLAKIGNVGAHLYVDAEGDILQIVIPLSALVIAREGWQGRIEVKLPEPDLAPETRYIEGEITFPAADVTIAGAVTVPQDGKSSHPAVILISGSGPQDRNEDTPIPGPFGLKFGIFRTIADRLSNAGYLVLRYNDYGVPPSGGTFQTHMLIDRVNVARGAVRYLQSRGDVDKRRIGLIGHSEGGIIAPIVAIDDPEIKAIVLMAGTARPIDQVVLEQSLALSNSIEEFQATLPILMEGWREVRTGKDWGRFGGRDNQFLGWFRSHAQHDPYETMKHVRCRVAILNGALDLQVLPGNALNLALALEEAGNTGYVVKIFPELDHLFMRNTSGGGTGDYADFRRRLSRDFLDYLLGWLKDNL
jgi:dienelactone hydrolase